MLFEQFRLNFHTFSAFDSGITSIGIDFYSITSTLLLNLMFFQFILISSKLKFILLIVYIVDY